jgi:Tol biopolymer transport system component
VAYASDESGRFEVYVRTFPEPGGAWRISTAGGNFPAWSPDARELFYLAPDGRLMAVSLKLEAEAIEAGPPRPLFSPTIVDTTSHPYDVSPDGQRFLISGPPEGPPQPLAVIVNWPALLKRVP